MRWTTLLTTGLLACCAFAPGSQAQSTSTDDRAISWQVTESPLNSPQSQDTRIRNVRYGEDWASWIETETTVQYLDLSAFSLVSIDTVEQTAERTNLYAEARQRLDIYVALSEGGRRDVINFGAAGAFDRVWLEAAMGLASLDNMLQLVDTQLGFAALYKGQIVFTADYGNHENSLCQTEPLTTPWSQSALAWLPYAAPTHPDVLERLYSDDRFPCAFSFIVFSPDSPMGRREHWVQTPSESSLPATPPLDEGLTILPAGAERLTDVISVAETILNGEYAAAPDPISFFDTVEALRQENDFAGALLASVQETHHFGPCPEASIGSIRLTCANASALALEGSQDPDFNRASQGIEALEAGRYADAVDSLSTFLDRDGYAGAAARALTAHALIGWGRVGLQARPDLDPAGLLAESLSLDPYAAELYWSLGERYLAAGAPAPAWTLFDIGRALPGREDTPELSQSNQLEDRMQELAPYWLPQSAEAR